MSAIPDPERIRTGIYETHYMYARRDLDDQFPLIVGLHGLSLGGCASFAFLFDHLTAESTQAQHDVLIYDYYGRGLSDCPLDRDYTVEFYIEQFEALLNALQISPTRQLLLIGYSMGGALAVSMADRFPDRVKGLILLAPAGLREELSFTGKLAMYPLLGEFMIGVFGTNALRKGLPDEFVDVEDAAAKISYLEEHFDAQILVSDGNFKWAILSTLRHFPLVGLTELFRRVAAHSRAVLICFGDQDNVVDFNHSFPALQEIFAARSTFHVIPQTKHAILHSQPTLLYQHIDAYLDSYLQSDLQPTND